jgi:hypothetical protein
MRVFLAQLLDLQRKKIEQKDIKTSFKTRENLKRQHLHVPAGKPHDHPYFQYHSHPLEFCFKANKN